MIKIPSDKMAHYIAGQAAFTAAFLMAWLMGLGWLANYFGLSASIAAGILKEVYDKKYGGNVEFADILATISGGLVLFLFSFL